ncbi:RDD family protein [Micromonospora sp. KC723]|uniref:RDD family protein n=1 Tax=Micromonospora sp. KC723 TaxID=2530381 RepID=UPI001048B6D4|nr:RDD family protein [Micromonospora sp. KC723]TDB75815.1 RDD family protein [Micromonospora sp. KC723]
MTAQPPASAVGRPDAHPAPGGPAGRFPTWGDAGLVSGEAVELDVRVARLGSRVLALLLDAVAQVALAVVFGLLLTALAVRVLPAPLVDGAFYEALGTVFLVLVLVGYPVLSERFCHGRTLGKMAVGLRVVAADGGPVGLRQSLTRALVGVAVEWPGLVLPLFSWVAGVTVMLTDRRGRRLGDLVAGTLVVHTRSAQPWRAAPAIAPPLVGWAVTLDLTRMDDALALAVRQYLTRAHRFAEPSRSRLTQGLWGEVAAVTSPPPPRGTPEPLALAAVLAERNRRGALRLHHSRALTAALWPELAPPPQSAPALATPAPAPSTPTPDEPAPPTPSAVRPAAPGARTGPTPSVGRTPGARA